MNMIFDIKSLDKWKMDIFGLNTSTFRPLPVILPYTFLVKYVNIMTLLDLLSTEDLWELRWFSCLSCMKMLHNKTEGHLLCYKDAIINKYTLVKRFPVDTKSNCSFKNHEEKAQLDGQRSTNTDSHVSTLFIITWPVTTLHSFCRTSSQQHYSSTPQLIYIYVYR